MLLPIARSGRPYRGRGLAGPLTLIAAMTTAVACRESVGLRPSTTILSPAAGGEAFEPTIGIDPANPDRLLAAAMYGIPFGRGGTGIWIWRSADGGLTWTDGRLDPPRFPDIVAAPTFAADVIAGFAQDGTPVLASMSDLPPLGGTFLSRLAGDSLGAKSVPVYRNTIDSAAGRRVLHDKPWMIVDRDERSPHRGSIYLSVGAITTGLGPAGPGVDWRPLGSKVLLAVSHDDGRTFSSPTVVGDSSVFGGYLTLGPAGSLEVSYLRLKTKDGAGDAVFHRRSSDGGVTFGPADTIAAMTGDTLLELPVLAARPNGDLLACWSQGTRADERVNQVSCATRRSGGAWGPRRGIESALPSGVVPAWPAVVGTEHGWYLMLYLVGAARTEVALFRSIDGQAFSRIATLSAADGLGIDRTCVATATACRRTRKDGFAIGDYVTLSAAGSRLAAAYVLPRSNAPTSGAAIYVTTLPEPAR